MFVTSPTQSASSSTDATYECDHCGGDRYAHASVRGSYCSTECYRSHLRSKAASEIFRLLETDHRFCYTCHSQLKDVHKPSKTVVVGPPQIGDHDWEVAKDVLVGFQTRLPAAEIGEKSTDLNTSAGWIERDTVDNARTATICRCGNTEHSHREPVIQRLLGLHVADRLIEAVETLQEEDKIDTRIDEEQLRKIVDSRPPLEDPIRFALTESVILDE